MDSVNSLLFKFEEVELKNAKMDPANVQSGCWGDSGSDYANIC